MTKIDFPRKPIAFLVYFIKTLPSWERLSIFLLMGITASVTVSNFWMLYGFKLLVDALPVAEPSNLWGTLKEPFLIIALNCAFHTIMYRVRDYVDLNSTPYIQNNLREMILENVSRHSHDYFHNRFSGELVNKINNINNSYRNLLWDRLLHGFIPTMFSILSSFVILWGVDPALSGILIACVFAILMSSFLIGGRLSKASADLADSESGITGQLIDTVTNISSVKNYANHDHEIHLLRSMQRPYVRDYKRFVWWEIAFWGMFDIFICTMLIGFVLYLIENWAKGIYTAGSVLVAIMIAWDMWYRMVHLSWQLTQLSADFGRIGSALNEFVRPLSVEDKTNAPSFHPQDGGIRLKDISFSYEGKHKVFDHLDLTIAPSQRVGIVGLSGAGKTTLCQLLLRNYDVTSGEILIGEQNIAEVTQESLRRKIAVIPQDPSLFHRSLRENIRYGRPQANEDEILAAAKAAQAHDFIMATPDGYDTLVGERGVKLSGGQRQRIAIARAILKDAPLLILDEATSALDSETERMIQEALETAMKGRTTIVVAHRLSTLAHLDRILVMKDGRIVEDGTLQQLIEKGGHFAYLWNLQAGGFLPEKL